MPICLARRARLNFLLAIALLAWPTGSRMAWSQGQPPGRELTAEMVEDSIQRGVQFLRGRDTEYQSYPGGLPSLMALALLNCGLPPSDPDVARLLNRIRQLDVDTDNVANYTIALRIMALAAADPEGKLYKREIRKDVDWLVAKQVKEGPNIGGWFYGILGGMADSADPSNSQFSVLALHEAARVGVEVDQEVWKRAALYWGSNIVRAGDGGFRYSKRERATGSMTCAGLSSWEIITENLSALSTWVDEQGNVVCCGQDNQVPYLAEASAWLGRNFSVRENPGIRRRGTHFYYLYALERAGRLSGQRFFGPHDWYREGAQKLIELQKRNGAWGNTRQNFGESVEELSTSFALLFLSKGKRPVVFGKYQHASDDDWDRHPKGVHQLTKNLEEVWNTKLNWQTVRARDADVNDVLEARVLVISGRDDLRLAGEQKQVLKKYIENGGFILAEASLGEGCGDGGAFDRQFRMLMQELFPESRLEPLPPEHPVWNALYQIEPAPGPGEKFPILGLQACCRTSVIYCPRTLTARWQVDRRGLREQLNRTALAEVDWCTQLGVNVATYATGRVLRDKLATPTADQGNSVLTLEERALVLPKLIHNGGPDEAPNAWRNVLQEAQALGLRVKLERKLLPVNIESLSDHPFVFIHGRNGFTFTDEERAALRAYIGKGGFVLADAICASAPFAEAFRKEMKAIFPENELRPIPADHPLWTDEKFGFALPVVTLRKPDPTIAGGFREIRTSPQMEGLFVDGQLQVVFSPWDLSCALENTTVSQCAGYTREDAAIMAIKILLYYLRRSPDE